MRIGPISDISCRFGSRLPAAELLTNAAALSSSRALLRCRRSIVMLSKCSIPRRTSLGTTKAEARYAMKPSHRLHSDTRKAAARSAYGRSGLRLKPWSTARNIWHNAASHQVKSMPKDRCACPGRPPTGPGRRVGPRLTFNESLS